MGTAVVDTQTNLFEPAGHVPDARYIVVTVPRTPDVLTEKYSGNPASPIAAMSAAEQAATQAAVQRTRADAETDAALNGTPTDLLMAVAQMLPGAIADMGSGAYDPDLFVKRVKAEVKRVRRART